MTQEPTAKLQCPACASKAVVKGSVIASDENERFSGRFFPEGLKFATLRRSVAVLEQQGFVACTQCGCLWNHVDPVQLQAVLKNRKRALGEEGPFAPGPSYRAKWVLLLLLGLVVLVAASGVVAWVG